ncbi:MAG: hypothetical protein JXK05_09000 [Campylobacterales bacterium]|nr:hypothetical protein [Campylobacterales bacterium]
MRLLLPMDGDDAEESRLVALADVQRWAVLEIEEGQVRESLFVEDRSAIEEGADAVVVCSDNEYVWPFLDEQMMVLVAHTQRSIDDIVEAYLFRELHELAY